MTWFLIKRKIEYYLLSYYWATFVPAVQRDLVCRRSISALLWHVPALLHVQIHAHGSNHPPAWYSAQFRQWVSFVKNPPTFHSFKHFHYTSGRMGKVGVKIKVFSFIVYMMYLYASYNIHTDSRNVSSVPIDYSSAHFHFNDFCDTTFDKE